MLTLLALLVALSVAIVARASIYVTAPASGSTCQAGKPCQVDWVDDGEEPLLTSMGVCNVGLYAHTMALVQSLGSVNVSNVHSLTFTPNAKSGPNFSDYYIAFVSTSNPSQTGYSPFFALDGMTGSFSTPATSSGGGSASHTTSKTGPLSSVPHTSTGTKASTTSSGVPTSSGKPTITTTSSTHSTTTSTTSTTKSTATKTNAAVPNGMPATGFAWTIVASLFSAAFF